MIDPRPDAVSANTIAITIASNSRSASTRGLGPPTMPPAIATTTATVAARVRPWTVEILDTSQPTSDAMGRTRTTNPSTNHSARVGPPSMLTVCLPVTSTTTAELSMNTANAASAGADRGHSRRTSRPGRSTAGSPRSRNHLSAARRCSTSIVNGAVARDGVAVDSGVVPVRRHGRRLLRDVA